MPVNSYAKDYTRLYQLTSLVPCWGNARRNGQAPVQLFLLWSEAEYCARWIRGLNQSRIYYPHKFTFKKRKQAISEIDDVECCTQQILLFPNFIIFILFM